jgi:predicted DCC family thiol-disulfide oxidoreductase YuxK
MTSKQAVLIFDGDCGFCTTTANFIEHRSSTPIEIHPWQFIDVTKYGLTEAQVSAKVYMVVNGQAFAGHEAFAQILILQRNLFLRALGRTLMAPPFSWLARPGYALVAKYRHKLPGGTPACKIEKH